MRSDTLAVIIPTKDRRDDMIRLLKSIAAQDVIPAQVIIVDGGVDPVKREDWERCGLEVDYVRKIPPSLTAQRNAGVAVLRPEITLVSFLDDDIELEKDALGNMMKFWDSAGRDTGGASFNITTDSYKRPVPVEKIFLVN